MFPSCYCIWFVVWHKTSLETLSFSCLTNDEYVYDKLNQMDLCLLEVLSSVILIRLHSPSLHRVPSSDKLNFLCKIVKCQGYYCSHAKSRHSGSTSADRGTVSSFNDSSNVSCQYMIAFQEIEIHKWSVEINIKLMYNHLLSRKHRLLKLSMIRDLFYFENFMGVILFWAHVLNVPLTNLSVKKTNVSFREQYVLVASISC